MVGVFCFLPLPLPLLQGDCGKQEVGCPGACGDSRVGAALCSQKKKVHRKLIDLRPPSCKHTAHCQRGSSSGGAPWWTASVGPVGWGVGGWRVGSWSWWGRCVRGGGEKVVRGAPTLAPTLPNFLVGGRQWGAAVRRPSTCNSVSVGSVEFLSVGPLRTRDSVAVLVACQDVEVAVGRRVVGRPAL